MKNIDILHLIKKNCTKNSKPNLENMKSIHGSGKLISSLSLAKEANNLPSFLF